MDKQVLAKAGKIIGLTIAVGCAAYAAAKKTIAEKKEQEVIDITPEDRPDEIE